jgi:hypothetical protein
VRSLPDVLAMRVELRKKWKGVKCRWLGLS